VERTWCASASVRRCPRRLAAWADDVTGSGLDASHFLVEDQPEQTAQAVSALLERAGPPLDRGDLTAPEGVPPLTRSPSVR
jgi:hypothetical protein